MIECDTFHQVSIKEANTWWNIVRMTDPKALERSASKAKIYMDKYTFSKLKEQEFIDLPDEWQKKLLAYWNKQYWKIIKHESRLKSKVGL